MRETNVASSNLCIEICTLAIWTTDAACGPRPITLDAVSPTTVLGEDADIGHTPAGGLALSQNEKRRRDDYQLSVFYTTYFRTTSGSGARTACIDPLEPRLRSSKHGDLTCL